jgi:hypothetical protein
MQVDNQYMIPNYYTQDPMRQRLTQLEAAQMPYQMQPYSMPTQRTPQMYPQIKTGRCIGESILPISRICPVKKGRSRQSASIMAEMTSFLI